MNRRDVLFGGGMIAAAAGAQILQPRDRLLLLPEGRLLEDAVPKVIGPWQKAESEAFVLPKTPGSLADKLYNQTLSRFYVAENNVPVMLVNTRNHKHQRPPRPPTSFRAACRAPGPRA